MAEIFLGRTEEQERFRQALTSFQPGWAQRHLPTLTKLVGKSPQKASEMTALLLFYGEGGMGKTTLTNRLHQIVKRDAAFQDQFQVLWLDWETQQKVNLELQVGHDSIRPETVLHVLHKAMVEAGWGGYFENYRKLVQEIQKIEAKVEKELRSPASVDLPKEVTNLGTTGIAWLIRRAGVEVSTENVSRMITVSAEGLYQTRQLVEKALTPKEFDTYTQPHEKLAEALGKGLAELAKRKPVVILLDTFEIVDRPECDYTLRTVIRCGGERVVWVIAGRSNLADSGRRGKEYFRGYKADFPEDRIYAKSMSEFGVSEIEEYFAAIAPERPITQEQVSDLARFSLGIPFVVSEAAAMWREGAAMATIVAPVEVPLGNISAHQRVVNQSSERFLKHCFSAKEQEKDLQAVYALAMVRRPDVDLLKAMLDCANLEEALRSLRERYSFILVDPVGLSEKLASFVREYLLPDVRRTTPAVQQVTERAIAWLELTLETQTRPLTDTAEWFEDDRIAEWIIALACFHFWQSEDAGWRYLAPRFVEGWQYNRRWTSNLLEAVEFFQPYWSKDGQRRFKLFSQGLSWSAEAEDTQRLLTELDKLTQRQYLDGTGATERNIILRFKKGQLRYKQENYAQTLQVYLEVKKHLTETTIQLKTDLAGALYTLSSKFIWAKSNQSSAYSPEGEQAIEAAVTLNVDTTGSHYYNLGVAKKWAGKYEEAIAAYQQAIALDPNDALPHNGLGNVYGDQGKYEEAIAAYQQAIALDPNYALPHNGLGNVYGDQGKYEEAIAAYQQAIALDPNYANPHNGLGIVYRDQGRYEEAIAAYQQAIALDPNDANPHNGLGNVYGDQGKYEEAIAAFQQAIALDPNYANPHYGLGNVYYNQGKYEEAIAAYQQAIALDPNYAAPHIGLGIVYYNQGKYEEAIAAYQQAIALDPNYAAPHNGLGIVYYAQGKYEEAIAAYQQAIALGPNDALPHNGLGNVYHSQGKYEEAIAAYQQAIALDPNYAYPHNGLGIVYRAQGKYEEAIAAYQQVIALDPKADYVYNNLGEVYLSKNQLVEAETAFREAIHLGGERYNRISSLGLIKALQGHQDEAITLWRKSQSLCTGTSVQERLNWVLINVALEDETFSQSEMQQVIAQSQSSKGSLQETLNSALLLARCPVKPGRVDELIGLLRAALSD